MSHWVRPILKFLIDLALWVLAGIIAFFLRIDNPLPLYTELIVGYSLLGMGIKGLIILWSGYHRQSWRLFSVADLYALIRGTALGTVILLAASFMVYRLDMARSIPLMEGMLALLMQGAVRLVSRFVYDFSLRRAAGAGHPQQRVLIVGAGDSGVRIAHELLHHPKSARRPVAFLDEDPGKHKMRYVGLEVLGGIEDLPEVIREARIDEVLIAIPHSPGGAVRRVVELARQSKVPHKIIPDVHEIVSGRVLFSQLREVDVVDLLRREPVNINLHEIAGYLEDQTVLVTGAGGSIGSELVRQIAHFHPRQMILLGRGENSLFELEHDLQSSLPDLHYQTIVTDLQRADKIDRIIGQAQPQVVFHAAAHKHVPLMETNPDEAILNNIGGTRNLLAAALHCDVRRFINISTDKAVNPTSIMGASKRIAEYLVTQTARQAPNGAVYASVRFGNVLGSRGSVVPVFKQQIKAGGPVTVTDPQVTRYFMTIPEAVQLVLQAGGLGANGALYVLDMGEPVRILDLARDLIQLSGYAPDEDILIKFVGLRPGEKLYEEPIPSEEGMVRSRHPKIYVSSQPRLPETDLDSLVDDLLAAARTQDIKHIRKVFEAVVPGYSANGQRPSQASNLPGSE